MTERKNDDEDEVDVKKANKTFDHRKEAKSHSMPLKSFLREDNSVRFDRQKGREALYERDD